MAIRNRVIAKNLTRQLATAWLLAALIVSGCYTGHEGHLTGLEAGDDGTVMADAYAFNARIWRDGKPTSFKLELYVTDTLIGIAARGYLGKGAFKGWLNSDSIKLYIPSSNELIYESLDNLVKNSDCGVSVAGLGFLSLFYHTPDSIAMPSGVAVSADYQRPDRPEFRAESTADDCPWDLRLRYDRPKSRLLIERMEFDNGRGVRLRAERERFRARIDIPQKRFRVEVPADAIRTIP